MGERNRGDSSRGPDTGDEAGATVTELAKRRQAREDERLAESGAPWRRSEGRRPSRRRFDNRLLIGLVAIASGIAAAVTPAHPTGISLWDLVLKVLVGAGAALAGAVCSWLACLAGAVIVGAASVRQPALVPVAAVLGVGAAELWSGRRGPEPQVIRAAAAAVVAQVALRLTWPHQSWAQAVIGSVAVLVILTSGLRRAPRRARRVGTWVTGLVVLATAALGAVAAGSILLARSPFEQGIQLLKAGGRAAQSGDETTAAHDFASADRLFTTAQHDLRFSGTSEAVPVLAQQVRAVRVATGIATEVASVAQSTATNVDLRGLRFAHGVVPLAQIARLGPVFRTDLGAIDDALSRTEPLRSPWLVSPLHDRVDEVIPELQKAQLDARTGVAAVQQAPGMLGANGTRRYLVLFVNPAEQRASGGVVGNYAVLTASHGHLQLGRIGSVAKLDATGSRSSKKLIGPPDYLARYSQFEPEYYWQNVPMSPNFPSVGEVAANLFPESGGRHVDGVISVDPVAIADMLKATGPIDAPGWGQPISRSNAVAALANGQFVKLPVDKVREAFLTDLIKGTWHALLERPLPALPQFTKDLAPAVLGHHLLIYSSDASQEHMLSLVHLSGAMPQPSGDFLDVVTQNFGGNKLDWYLRRSIDYDATVNRHTGGVDAVMTLNLHNSAPSSGLPPIVIGPQPGVNLPVGTDDLWVSVYSPWNEISATLDGKPVTMVAQHELGHSVYSAIVTVPPGGEATLVIHLQGSWPHRDGRYHLTIAHQPLLFPDKVTTKTSFISGSSSGR